MLENILWAKTIEKFGEMSLDMVEQIIQCQHNLLSNTLTALVVIAGFIAAASVGYNIYISRKKLEDIKTDIISELAEKTDEIIEPKLEKMEERINEDIKNAEARLGRGITAVTARIYSDPYYKKYELAATFYALAAQYSDELKEYDLARNGLDLAIKNLKKIKFVSQKHKDEIKRYISSLHISLNSEKEQIEQILDKLPIK
jgi:predicted nuclease with TOPRIM domain